MECGNYRPISCISHVANILEKVIHEQLKDYLFEHHFITNDQSAYRFGHSTVTALHRVVIDLLNGANEGLVSGVCFFDIAKCFDTIDHGILLTKLEKYGVKNNALKLCNSYLDGR